MVMSNIPKRNQNRTCAALLPCKNCCYNDDSKTNCTYVVTAILL